MAQGWDPSSTDYPRAPINGQALPTYTIGVLDLRWDDPRILASNSAFSVVGVNVYRSETSDRGPYFRLNDFPVGGCFWRDATQNVSVREVVDWNTAWVYKGDKANSHQWTFRTKNPIVKRVPHAPYQKPTFANSIHDVTLYIDGVEVPVHDVFGPTGEVTLINQAAWNQATETFDNAAIPTASSTVEIVYWANRNFVSTSFGKDFHYRLATVVLDSTSPTGYRETPLVYCEPVTPAAVETLDYIWREAIRRNHWILQQGGERVKVFVRKMSGVSCTCQLDPRLVEYSKQPSQRCTTCFPPGTEITMANFTRRPIETLNIGDEVLTHKGRVRRIYDVTERVVHEDLIRIDATHGVGFSVTGNHPVLIMRYLDTRCRRCPGAHCTGQNSKGICTGKPWTQSCDYDRETKYQWVDASEIRVGDCVAFPVGEGNTGAEVSTDALRFLGYYAAEGWTSKNRRGQEVLVGFGFHVDEVPTHVTELSDIVLRMFGTRVGVHYRKQCKGVQLHLTSKDASQLALEHVGKYSKLKELSRQLVWQPMEGLRQFLGAYINGDGWQCLNHMRTHVGISTASYSMARQVEGMLLRLGIVPRFSYRTRRVANPGRFGFHDTTSYEVAIRKGDMRVLEGYMKGVPLHAETSGGWAFRSGGFVLYPVQKVSRVHYCGPVFNLEVEEDHTYIAGGATVHNCYGTGWVGGYEGPYDTMIVPDDADKRYSQQPTGRKQEHSYEVWTVPSPIVTMRDFIVKQTNERYSIGPVRKPSNRGNVLQQHFTIASMDDSDIRYQVPIDGVDLYTYPETRYGDPYRPPVPQDGDFPIAPPYISGEQPYTTPYPNGYTDTQYPQITQKDGWPDQKQPRGRSPVWDNINK